MAVFQGIPAIYSIQPTKTHKRRTATSIMAGHFDPDFLLSVDSQKDHEAVSNVSTMFIDEPIAHVPGVHQWEIRQVSSVKRKGLPSKRFGDLSSASAVLGDPKEKRVNRVSAAGKENTASALSDDNLSVRLSQTSVIPPPVPLKRKLSPVSQDDQQLHESKKRPRLLESVVTHTGAINALTISSAPCPPVSPAHSPLVSKSISDIKDSAVEKLTKADAPKLYEVSKNAGVRCKICSKLCVTVSFMEIHLRNLHSDRIDMNAMPKPAERKPRGPRKNVAIRKGWKGWVEDQPAPQNLILLDNPEVLPERTTRSGRKIT